MDFKFKDYGISTIIIIDDSFNKIDKSKYLDEFPPDIIDELTDGYYDQYCKYTIEDYIKKTNNIDFENKLSNRIRETTNLKMFEEGVDLQLIGVEDIEQVKDKLSKINADDKSRKNLIILDRKLQEDVKGVAVDEKFKDILKTIQSLIEVKNLLLLIYTQNEKPDELNSFEGAKKHLKKLGLDDLASEQMAHHFNYVKKSDDLTPEFFENVLKSQKANYLQRYKHIFEKSFSKLSERLWELNQNYALFFYDYLNEGKHTDDIIYDIFLAKFHQEYSEEFSELSGHNAFINPIRRSMQQSMCHYTTKTDVYSKIKNLEKGIHSHNNIIKVPNSTDISFGDVLEIGDKKYMILSQDCDIVIRNEFKRKLKNFQLVEIEEEIENVSEKWLSDFLKKKPKVNMQDSSFKCTLKNFGIEESVVNKITNANVPTKDLSTSQINNMKYSSDIKPKTKQIYSINCIWLDLLVLRCNESEEILLSKDNIIKSHEIRYATKKYIENELDDLIIRISDIAKIDIFKDETKTKEKNVQDKIVQKITDKIINFGFGGLDIKCKSQFSEENKLIGFSISNIKRIGRLDRLDAMRILKTVIDDESRIPEIFTLVI